MRTQLGQLNVQGFDYAYTLQAWLKGLNSTAVDPSKDMGLDGNALGQHQLVARDVLGFDLHYYDVLP